MKPLALPYPRYRIEEWDLPTEGLISINPSNPHKEKELPLHLFEKTLFLYFDDIPVPEATVNGKKLKGPTTEDVQKALAFATGFSTKNTLIAVHCMAGKSRSTAIALAIHAKNKGAGKEEEAVLELLAYDPNKQFCFNPGIIQITDRLFNNNRAIEKALEKHCSPYNSWKKYWKTKL